MGFGVAGSVPAVFMMLDEEDLSLAKGSNWHHEKTSSSHLGLSECSSPLPSSLPISTVRQDTNSGPQTLDIKAT